MGLGILEHLEGRPTPWGLTKSYDSQCETNGIIKRLKENESYIFVQTDDDISLWPRIISRNPPTLLFAVSPVEWTCCPGPFPNWDSRLLLPGTSQHAVLSLNVGWPNLVVYVLLLLLLFSC